MIIPLEAYLAYIAMVLVFFAHPPGPGQLLFMAHSMKRGVRGAFPVILGNHSANIFQMFLAGFGLAGVVGTSASLFLVVKWLGVAYLLWLGVAMIRGGAAPARSATDQRTSLARQGFVTAAANPFAVIFFVALFPQFLNPDAPIGPQIVILGATYLAIDGTILLAMGASASKISLVLGGLKSSLVNRASGALMLVAALVLAVRGIEPETEH